MIEPVPSAGNDRAKVQKFCGLGLMLATVAIWTGFILTIRLASTSTVNASDVALVRFGLPVLLLLPFLLMKREPISLRGVRWQDVAMVAAGAGLPFFMLAVAGAHETSAAYVGALIPGTAPLAISLLRPFLGRHRLKGSAPLGLAAILCGVVILSANSGGIEYPLRGIVLLLAASLCWACYTIGLQNSGLTPAPATLLVCLPSLAVLLGMAATGVTEFGLLDHSAHDLMPFILVQGVGVGVLASLSYTAAIRRIGAQTGAAIGALTPAVVAILAPLTLSEPLHFTTLIGVATVTAGVLFSTWSGFGPTQPGTARTNQSTAQ